MNKIIFDNLLRDYLPWYNLDDKNQPYLYYNPKTNLIEKHIDWRTSKCCWSEPIDSITASKIVNTLAKTNYKVTVCGYDYTVNSKLVIVAFACNQIYYDEEELEVYPPWFINDIKYNPDWFTKE